MSRRTETCVVWTCDDCNEEYMEVGVTTHLAADEAPYGWETIDGKDVCEECFERRHCAKYGHAWSAWYQGTSEHRWCETCGTTERRDA